MNVLDRITLNLNGIGLLEPPHPPIKGEVEVGELPPELKQLYSLLVAVNIAHRDLHAKLLGAESPKDHTDPADQAAHEELHAAQAYLSRIFFDRLRRHVDPKVKKFKGLGVKKGWIIIGVNEDPDPQESFFDGGGVVIGIFARG